MNSIAKSSDQLSVLAGLVILAGGASRRMGTPKAKLTLPTGEQLLDYHVRQAIKLNVPIMIADNGHGFKVNTELLASNPEVSITHIADYNSTSVVDNAETEGPLVAIESALQLLTESFIAERVEDKRSSWLMVISCDSLITAHDLWQQLSPCIESTADEVKERAFICLTDDSHLYPLLGLYNLSVEPKLRAYIDSGERKVMTFIKPIAQTVPVPKEWLPLTNFNTPAGFKHACGALYDL